MEKDFTFFTLKFRDEFGPPEADKSCLAQDA